MYDGSTQTFERLKRPNTAQVIPVVGDKILIQKQEQPGRKDPYYSLAGGRCDGDEDPLIAAKRELLEETGLVSNDWTLWTTRTPYNKIVWTIYTARDCKRKQEPKLDAGERIENILLTFDQFLEIAEEILFYDRESLKILMLAKVDLEEKEKFKRLIFGK